MEERDAHYRDEEPPPRACPECGDDDRHEPDCSRNYRNSARATVVHDYYWLGWRTGKRVAAFADLQNHEARLKLEVHLIGDSAPRRNARAFALGELRGYREARA
jgi:hypothetical protein